MADRYLKQVLVVRKDLSMPTGKFGAMCAHAAVSFFANRLCQRYWPGGQPVEAFAVGGAFNIGLSNEEARWLTELDPGLEGTGQLSFATIVLEVDSEQSLLSVEREALKAGLQCHHVIDSGASHNKPGTLVALGLGPDWPEKLEPVTGALKVYR